MPEYLKIAKVKCQKCGRTLLWANEVVGKIKCAACGLEQVLAYRIPDKPVHIGPIITIIVPTSQKGVDKVKKV